MAAGKQLKAEVQWYVDSGHGDPFAGEPLIINAALTGMVPTKEMTPHVPIAAEEIVDDAERCFRAGASVLHLHARGADGLATWEKEAYADMVVEIRQRCPGVVLCLTCSGRRFNTFDCRSDVLNLEADARPDMASLTLGSMNFPGQPSVNSPEMIQLLALRMRERGVMPELEVFEPGMLNYALYLERKGILSPPHWFNLLLGSLGTMPARVRDLDFLLEMLPAGCRWAAAGIGRYQLPVNLLAIRRGGHVRVGLEDNIHFDNERRVLATNEMLVGRLAEFGADIGRLPATPAEARRIIGIGEWRHTACCPAVPQGGSKGL
jgi:3-keto-5-aminohexanoate cleavage enzyme